MKRSQYRYFLICCKDKKEDVENYLKAKRIDFIHLDQTDLNALEHEIDLKIQSIMHRPLIDEACITILLYDESCRLAFSLQQKTQAQLICVNPPVLNIFGKELPVIESDDDFQILLTIKHLCETGT